MVIVQMNFRDTTHKCDFCANELLQPWVGSDDFPLHHHYSNSLPLCQHSWGGFLSSLWCYALCWPSDWKTKKIVLWKRHMLRPPCNNEQQKSVLRICHMSLHQRICIPHCLHRPLILPLYPYYCLSPFHVGVVELQISGSQNWDHQCTIWSWVAHAQVDSPPVYDNQLSSRNLNIEKWGSQVFREMKCHHNHHAAKFLFLEQSHNLWPLTQNKQHFRVPKDTGASTWLQNKNCWDPLALAMHLPTITWSCSMHSLVEVVWKGRGAGGG